MLANLAHVLLEHLNCEHAAAVFVPSEEHFASGLSVPRLSHEVSDDGAHIGLWSRRFGELEDVGTNLYLLSLVKLGVGLVVRTDPVAVLKKVLHAWPLTRVFDEAHLDERPGVVADTWRNVWLLVEDLVPDFGPSLTWIF